MQKTLEHVEGEIETKTADRDIDRDRNTHRERERERERERAVQRIQEKDTWSDCSFQCRLCFIYFLPSFIGADLSVINVYLMAETIRTAVIPRTLSHFLQFLSAGLQVVTHPSTNPTRPGLSLVVVLG